MLKVQVSFLFLMTSIPVGVSVTGEMRAVPVVSVQLMSSLMLPGMLTSFTGR